MATTVSMRCVVQKRLADTITPVSVYLRLRDLFPESFLLESTENQLTENSFSYICCEPIATFSVKDETIDEHWLGWPDRQRCQTKIEQRKDVALRLQSFISSFETDLPKQYSFLNNGLFGYIAFDAIRYFEELDLQEDPDETRDIPDILYHAFRYIFAIDHYRNELYILENQPIVDGKPKTSSHSVESLSYLIDNKDFPFYQFATKGEVTSNFADEEYKEVVETCKRHVFRGDVFQVVPSRRFTQAFLGDEFNVYRSLRSINPSPYLFYFDCGSFKIFGSSPEAQLIVKQGTARLFPIAGTYRRTDDEKVDELAIMQLAEDPKENAEHVMLVDLARNDLSKHCSGVTVEKYKDIQRYSHVIHLTSQVKGTLNEGATAVNLLADTFPMGTLSGAPKYRAIEIINAVERGKRRVYGGAIGVLAFDGSCNHAIVIRSFLSKGNVLFWQAGGGIVADSLPEDELQEVKNKLAALTSALVVSQSIR